MATTSSALAASVAAGATLSGGTLSRLFSGGEITSLTVRELADAIRHRRLSSREVVLAFLDRIQTINGVLNAVVQLRTDSALRDADVADTELAAGIPRGPLHGVPMTIKDSFDTAGVISTAGTPGRAEYVPSSDATVVARLRQAGGILLGKTNTPELTLSGETDNSIYGRTNNPYDVDRTPGGSSGGPAAIVAACGSPFDIGSDTGGSIRGPAHCCGIAGFKPTAGRVPRTGHIVSFQGALQSLTQIGPLARSVDDVALITKVINGEDGRDPFVVNHPLKDLEEVSLPSLRVGFYTSNGTVTPTPDIVATVESAVLVLSEGGAIVNEVSPPGVGRAHDLLDELLLGDPSWIKRLLSQAGTVNSPLLAWVKGVQPMALEQYSATIEEWDRYRSEMLEFIRNFDVLVTPAVSTPAPVHGQWRSVQHSFFHPFNLVGWPAAVIRGGTSPAGLPLGVQVVGRAWRNDVVLSVAKFLEAALGPFPGPRI